MSEAPAPTFEQVGRDIRRAGYRLNNLMHRLDGLYQCNLRRDNTAFFEFAYGGDAVEAMQKALAKARSGKMVVERPPHNDDADPTVTGQTKAATSPVPPGEMPDRTLADIGAQLLTAGQNVAINTAMDDLIG